MLSAWLRVIRVRFLLSSVIAVSVGIAAHWWSGSPIDVASAALTLGGVMALHASVDMLNDYWDFKRGIDTRTVRTGMSGGTGVLPEGLLRPEQVYRAGIASLVLGTAVGAYFVVTGGIIIAVLLGFAVLSIYFYSTKIVDSGLAEVFVAVKGACIVMGTYFIQAGDLHASAVLGGIVVGILSSTVLFVTSFPDHDADKSRGRRTLVVAWGRRRAASSFWIFPASAYGALLAAVVMGALPVPALAALLAAPLAAASGIGLRRRYGEDTGLVPVMNRAVWFARAAGALLAAGLVVAVYT